MKVADGLTWALFVLSQIGEQLSPQVCVSRLGVHGGSGGAGYVYAQGT